MAHEIVPSNRLKDVKGMDLFRAKLDNAARKRKGKSFDYECVSVGRAADGRVEVWAEKAQGTAGTKAAMDLLANLAPLMDLNDDLFGVKGTAGNVLVVALDGITDGSGGAYHYACAFNDKSPGGSDWYVDLALDNGALVLGLAQAEISESYMGLQGKGWECGWSTGEALSRVLAEQVSGGPDGALAEYASGPAWYEAGMPDFIGQVAQSDQDIISTGCGVVYLYWLLSLGYSLQEIVQAGCPAKTLASNYQQLTGQKTAWNDFATAVNGLHGPITSDNPWTGTPTTTTTPPPPPPGESVHITIDGGPMAGGYTLVPDAALAIDGDLSEATLDDLIARLKKLKRLLGYGSRKS